MNLQSNPQSLTVQILCRGEAIGLQDTLCSLEATVPASSTPLVELASALDAARSWLGKETWKRLQLGWGLNPKQRHGKNGWRLPCAKEALSSSGA